MEALMEALNVGDRIVFDNKGYIITRVISAEWPRYVYFVDDGKIRYVIKELLMPKRRLSKRIVRDTQSNQAVFADGFEPSEGTEPVCNREIEANEKAFRDKGNNSPSLFSAERLENTEPRAAAYLRIDSVTGDPLDIMREEWKELPEEELLKQAVDVVIKAANALNKALHQKGWLHLDVKPQNLYWTEDETVKLLDLGSAFPIPQESITYHPIEPIQSTTTYQSPLLSAISSQYSRYRKNTEHIAALLQKLSVRDDIFELAMTMVYLITGTEQISKIHLNDGINQDELMRVLKKATTGCKVEADGKCFEIGEYRDCTAFIRDLKTLREILDNKGLHEAVIQRNGIKLVRTLMNQQHLEIREDLLPDIRPLK